MMGAGKIIATDISDYKLELARAFGADIALNVNKTTEDERVELVRQNTGGRGADLCVECVGRPHVVNGGASDAAQGRMYLEPGNFVDCGSTPINIHEICSKNLRIRGMCNPAHTGYQDSMDMMLRTLHKFPWTRFISHVFPLDHAGEALIKSLEGNSMKVLIKP
jgi:L-iditol 2-dehydrogenase